MPRACSICAHLKLRDITADLMRRVPYRAIETRYGVSRSALERHMGHVSTALRTLAATEQLVNAETLSRPVLEQMRTLHVRTLKVLVDAERARDRNTVLAAVRECRHNLELCARLTGELAPRPVGDGALNVTVQFVDKQVAITGTAPLALASAPEGEQQQ